METSEPGEEGETNEAGEVGEEPPADDAEAVTEPEPEAEGVEGVEEVVEPEVEPDPEQLLRLWEYTPQLAQSLGLPQPGLGVRVGGSLLHPPRAMPPSQAAVEARGRTPKFRV